MTYTQLEDVKMADSVMAQPEQFPTHDEGQFAAVCADVIDLGQRVEQYQNKPARLAPKCALVFLTNSLGDVRDIAAEVTVSMGEKANLRILLEAWRGKSYDADQLSKGISLDRLVGHPALVSVEHKRSGKGRIYAKIKTIAPLPKEMTAPSLNGYSRPEFWATRKKEYADEAARFQQKLVATSPEPIQPVEDDDDLSF